MNVKWSRGPAVWLLLRFVVIFGLLIAPWPGWNQGYSHYFQSLAQMVFNPVADSDRRVLFAPATDMGPTLDTRITLENSKLADSNGRGLVERTDIDSRSIGWVPTALTIALVASTPIPWRRRLPALAAGLVLIHLFIFLTLQSWIWNNSPDLSLIRLSAFWKTAADDLNYALMNQLGASFSVPVMIWILVTFRRQDALAV